MRHPSVSVYNHASESDAIAMPAIAAADMTIVVGFLCTISVRYSQTFPCARIAECWAELWIQFYRIGYLHTSNNKYTTHPVEKSANRSRCSKLFLISDTRGCPPSSSMHRLILGMLVFLSGFISSLLSDLKHMSAQSRISHTLEFFRVLPLCVIL
ncbi:uncharacterized protein EDB93DRAFT_564093 [Suillus bovinus]|uniref:uncharacterized protein n=1 Tax=Suillus bovinus TaxID=48563 RepID=UPI001B880FE1|nr:uncharacterized protein EDB93DRAFT_564093 [Suillus bovinus]KAG2158755.1 hypothetical protein EDB93DRAFT_564093 [Suillus bovinus]